MIAPEILHELLIADFEAGTLTWRPRPIQYCHDGRSQRAWNTGNAGNLALTARHGAGYRHGTVLRQPLLAHRVIWAMATGKWPSAQIDHINGDRSDNCLANLREVSCSENHRNMRLDARNKTGVVGVFKLSEVRWLAQLGGRYIGVFPTIELAAEARSTAAKAAGYHDNHGLADRPAYVSAPAPAVAA